MPQYIVKVTFEAPNERSAAEVVNRLRIAALDEKVRTVLFEHSPLDALGITEDPPPARPDDN